MRLNRLDLTRYGHFTDRSLTFPRVPKGEADLHLVYGPNEAGKSTTLQAWLDLLFGIPLQSRMTFLHPGPTLRIGATLEIDGAEVSVLRVKKTAGSLQDAHGAVVPEALLQGGLGGLTRESYGAMFSLDDDTLEQGGDGILASRGDLGEMLFSASAGMADLGRKLEGLRERADAFHRSGGRKGPVTDTKARLAVLDDQRRALDVQAGAYKLLVTAEAEATAQWRAAQDDHARVAGELARVTQALGALPLQVRLRGLQAELAPLSALPPLPEGWSDRLQRLQKDREAAGVRREETQLALGRAERALAALTADPAILALASRIAAADALRGAHDEAVKDLPNRQREAQALAGEIAAVLSDLGQRRADPRGLLLPAPVVSALRALIASRSGLTARREAAGREAEKAQLAAARAGEKLQEAGAPGDVAALSVLLTRLKQRDQVDAVTRAARAATLAQDDLSRRLAALAPWRGTAEALAALPVPSDRQIEAWTRRAEALRVAVADASRLREVLAEEVARMTVSGQGPAAAPGLAEAAEARALRERLWAEHRQSLTLTSAAAFETAMRQDDRITALLAEMQAEARVKAAGQVVLSLATQKLTLAETALSEAGADLRAHEAEVTAAMASLGLPGHDLADLRAWAEARALALAAFAQWQAAERDRQSALQARGEAEAALAGALNRAPASYDLLWAEAQARIDADRVLSGLRDAWREARAALQQRQDDLSAATDALARWQADWQALVAGTWLEGQGADAVLVALSHLDRLEKAVLQHDGLTSRIEKMTANRDRFAAARAGIAGDLGLDAETPWDALPTRLRAAEQSRDAIAREMQAKADARQKLADLDAQDEAVRLALHQMAEALSCPVETLPAVVADSLKAAELRGQIATCQRDLRDAGADATPADLPDRAALEAEAARLTAERDQLGATLQERYAAMTEAARQLRDVGGDDAVARIEEERANLLEALADGARAHLAQRLGILVVNEGLRRYRDSHRSAMLARASEAFATLTRGAYRSLAAQPTEQGREVLVALPRQGGAKLATELSKGTRFQLYLALRVAGYHELAKSRRPVPFLADDIMETFDNGRAAEAFRLLAGMARTGQVIYLTHHEHLVDIARRECPGLTVHDLTQARAG